MVIRARQSSPPTRACRLCLRILALSAATRALRFDARHAFASRVATLSLQWITVPMREKSTPPVPQPFQLIQIRNALPARLCSGMQPHQRLSRLS